MSAPLRELLSDSNGAVDPHPGRLWSLWDMLRLYADRFVGLKGWLCQMQLAYMNPAPIGVNGPGVSPLSDERLLSLLGDIERGRILATDLNLQGTARILDRLVVAIGDPSDERRHMISNYADGIVHLLGEAALRLQEELGERYFVQLAEGFDDFYTASKPFASDVRTAFPGAKRDIEAACRCYALEAPHASIYHSMMVLEFGLTALTRRLKVAVKKDRSTWGPIIGEIQTKLDNELKALAQTPKGGVPPSTKKKTFLFQCQEAALEFKHFKNVWRDHIAHGRADYDQYDAIKVLEHVATFMFVLATKLKLKQVR